MRTAADYDWRVLEDMPTLTEGQADDLKVATADQRVWLSRATMMDGEHCDHHVTVETLIDGEWITTSQR